jgi:hypothetical protein
MSMIQRSGVTSRLWNLCPFGFGCWSRASFQKMLSNSVTSVPTFSRVVVPVLICQRHRGRE